MPQFKRDLVVVVDGVLLDTSSEARRITPDPLGVRRVPVPSTVLRAVILPCWQTLHLIDLDSSQKYAQISPSFTLACLTHFCFHCLLFSVSELSLSVPSPAA